MRRQCASDCIHTFDCPLPSFCLLLFVPAEPSLDHGSVTFAFYALKATTVQFAGKVLSPTDATASFYVSVDGGTPANWQPLASSGSWKTVEVVKSFGVSAGTHSLTVRSRSGGLKLAEVKIVRGDAKLLIGKGCSSRYGKMAAGGGWTRRCRSHVTVTVFDSRFCFVALWQCTIHGPTNTRHALPSVRMVPSSFPAPWHARALTVQTLWASAVKQSPRPRPEHVVVRGQINEHCFQACVSIVQSLCGQPSPKNVHLPTTCL